MAFIVTAIVSAVSAVVTWVGATLAAGGIGAFALRIGISVAAAALMRSLTPKAKTMDQGAQIATKLDSAYPREIAVGKFALGGSKLYENVSGTNNKYLWNVIQISDAEINQITSVQNGDEALTFSGDIHTGLRACTSHFQSASGGDMLYLRIYKGTDSQTVDSDLDAAFAEIDSNFRLRGQAYAVLRMEWDPDAWSGGEPQFVFVGEGAKCYDPRTGLTVYTDNVALIAGQYVRGFYNNGVLICGLGASSDDLPDDELIAAANECDEAVALAAGGTEVRYRAGGVISSLSNAREVMADLALAMGGKHLDIGGQIALLPGVARTPVLDIAEDDLLADEGIVFDDKRSAADRFNAIASTFVDPATGYQEGALPPRKDTAAITADGQRIATSRAYRFVHSKTQGQRLDEIELRRNRREGYFACSAPMWAFELTPGDWVTATNVRWQSAQKYFEVETVGLSISGAPGGGAPVARAALGLREIHSDVFAWGTGDEITTTPAAPTRPAALASNFDAGGRLNGAAFSGNPVLTGATAYRTPLNPLSSSDAGSTATVAIASHTLKTSEANEVTKTVSYNSGSVTGLSFTTSYFIWAYDPTFAGGAVTYVSSTSSETYIGNNGYIYVGYITTVDDGGGGGGSPPPPPEFCVAAWAWIDAERCAGAIQGGDMIDVLGVDMASVARARVDGATPAKTLGYRLVTTSGVTLTCSESTPITQPSGRCIRARDALGAQVAVDDELGLRWETIVEKVRVGLIDVARIHVGGRTYAAGDEPGRRMFTHNPSKP